MKNIAIIPARSGSKGVPHKNIKKINGLPLLAYSIRAAKQSGLFAEVMVSTDSAEYASIAKEYGANFPFLRSAEQSGDTADSWAVVTEVLGQYAKQGELFDTVCLLQPTSPLRMASDIEQAYALLERCAADAVTSVCEAEHSPLWCMTLKDDFSLKEFRSKQRQRGPRQALDKYYRLNGAIYIRRIRYADWDVEIVHENEYAMVMDTQRSVDIDTAMDLELAELYLKKIKGDQCSDGCGKK